MSPLPITYDPKQARPLFEPDSVGTHQVLNEQAFKRMLAIERNRTERSKEAFLLILFEASQRHQRAKRQSRSQQSGVPSSVIHQGNRRHRLAQ